MLMTMAQTTVSFIPTRFSPKIQIQAIGPRDSGSQ